MDIWHVLNRGVEKRNIVGDDNDRVRFIHDLYAFNSTKIVQHIAQAGRDTGVFSEKGQPLVKIHAYCLMKNHYHLLLSELVDRGTSRFMQKLNMGYAKYFNGKYQRSGVLWQGKHKKILINRDAHFMYIPYYIHLNPLDYSMPEWREGAVKNVKKALDNLRGYRWSSHLDYLGKHNFPSVIDTGVIADMLGTSHEYEREITNIISNRALADNSTIIEQIRHPVSNL